MISLCLLVKNEERNLARCVDSVRDLAGEIVVVDTGSTDGTQEIAAGHGAKVVAFDFDRVDFAAARNFGIGLARGEWVMVLDADETLDAASGPLVRELVGRGENAGYYFERSNKQPEGAAATTDYAVRLFPNGAEYRYRGRVHETVDASILAAGGRLKRSGVRIHHDFAADTEARRRRNFRYIQILKEEIAADPTDTTRLDFLAAEYHQLGMFGEATEVAKRIVAARPEDARAHLHLGAYYLMYKPDWEQARASFLEALRLKPGDAEALAFLEAMKERENHS